MPNLYEVVVVVVVGVRFVHHFCFAVLEMETRALFMLSKCLPWNRIPIS